MRFPTIQAQKTVKGKVKETGGTSLPGVGVIIKGTSIGTATDFDENYFKNTLTKIIL
jgi:iron complex outermembrane receptor protein